MSIDRNAAEFNLSQYKLALSKRPDAPKAEATQQQGLAAPAQNAAAPRHFGMKV